MIRFSEINQYRGKNYKPNYQRHHLIPRQAKSESGLYRMFKILENDGFNLDDFSLNGILLPCCEKEALRTGRPLHRGPHPLYNEIVIGRLLKISELGNQFDTPVQRSIFLNYRVSTLLGALYNGLNERRFQKIQLSSRDPMSKNLCFDQMIPHIERIDQNPTHLPLHRAQFSLSSTTARKEYISEL